MVGDGLRQYHHETDGMGTLLGGCQADLVNTEHPIRAKIIYASKTLEVRLRKHKELRHSLYFLISFLGTIGIKS